MDDSGKKNFAVIYNKTHTGHKPLTTSPENPERLTKIIEFLTEEVSVFDNHCFLYKDFEATTEQEALLVHEKRYIDFIKSYCEQGGGFLGDSTYLNEKSYEYALLAAGGAKRAALEVLEGSFSSSFALIRPPGHHASADSYGGYCILNNAAILARFLQKEKGLSKIMIVDWDSHAADGTMKIFFEDPSVLTVSLHRDPMDFYPHNGFINQIGARKGRGSNVNIIMPKTSGDEEYQLALKEIVLPLYHQFEPDFVIGGNGFDAHFSDEQAKMRMTSRGYYNLVSTLREEAAGKLTLLLEGGYTKYNGILTYAVIMALKGEELPYTNEMDVQSDALFREKPRKLLDENLKELKELLVGRFEL
jgi:acetoin utilization deacetylase AcuC-like enzyme